MTHMNPTITRIHYSDIDESSWISIQEVNPSIKEFVTSTHPTGSAVLKRMAQLILETQGGLRADQYRKEHTWERRLRKKMTDPSTQDTKAIQQEFFFKIVVPRIIEGHEPAFLAYHSVPFLKENKSLSVDVTINGTRYVRTIDIEKEKIIEEQKEGKTSLNIL